MVWSLAAASVASYVRLMPKPSTSPVPGLMAAIMTSMPEGSEAGIVSFAACMAALLAFTSMVV